MAKPFFTLQICIKQAQDMSENKSESVRDTPEVWIIEDESRNWRGNRVKNGRFLDFW
jgi:hypothetical protein